MKNNKSFERRLELSSKFLEMGQALMVEGKNKKDYPITQSGSFMILIAGLILEEKDVVEFGNLCSMFSAKKLLDSMEETNNNSYDELIKRLNKFRGDEDTTND